MRFWWAEVDSNQKARFLEALNPFIYKGFRDCSPFVPQMKMPLNFCILPSTFFLSFVAMVA